MIIRKLFKFEGAHIVRNCSTERCAKSIHGHSYKVEVFLIGDGLDNGSMIMDFSLFKGAIKDIIDSFDHAYSIWKDEKPEMIEFIKQNCDRYVVLPMSPSAESYSIMLMFLIDRILNRTVFKNGEKSVKVSSVRVHETDTGYAEAHRDDLYCSILTVDDFEFSEGVIREWNEPDILERMKDVFKDPFVNPDPVR